MTVKCEYCGAIGGKLYDVYGTDHCFCDEGCRDAYIKEGTSSNHKRDPSIRFKNIPNIETLE